MAAVRSGPGSTKGQLTYTFWNLNRQDRAQLTCGLVREHDVDVIVLAESGAASDSTLAALNADFDNSFFEPPSVTPKLQIFCRGEDLDLSEIYGDASGRVTIRRVKFDNRDFLFAAVHLVSKANWDAADQSTEIQVLADQIRKEEERSRHSRTILCGDLNMNPFEEGVVKAAGLHAMMTKATVADRDRTVQGREYPFFYNPMWGFFGDRTDGPPGTFYYRTPAHLSYEWNILDQVLIRPDALPWFRDDIEIVTTIGDTKLSDRHGRPDKDVGSDHFPIVFRLSALEYEDVRCPL